MLTEDYFIIIITLHLSVVIVEIFVLFSFFYYNSYERRIALDEHLQSSSWGEIEVDTARTLDLQHGTSPTYIFTISYQLYNLNKNRFSCSFDSSQICRKKRHKFKIYHANFVRQNNLIQYLPFIRSMWRGAGFMVRYFS